MKTLDIFVEWTNEADNAIDKIITLFPCFVNTTILEMNWREVTITARIEDIADIEKILAKIV